MTKFNNTAGVEGAFRVDNAIVGRVEIDRYRHATQAALGTEIHYLGHLHGRILCGDDLCVCVCVN